MEWTKKVSSKFELKFLGYDNKTKKIMLEKSTKIKFLSPPKVVKVKCTVFKNENRSYIRIKDGFGKHHFVDITDLIRSLIKEFHDKLPLPKIKIKLCRCKHRISFSTHKIVTTSNIGVDRNENIIGLFPDINFNNLQDEYGVFYCEKCGRTFTRKEILESPTLKNKKNKE